MDIHNFYQSSGAKPIFHRGNAVGCLCIHGFSAAPTEIGWLGDHLHTHMGMTTYAVRLAGHGASPEHMAHMRWRDWYGAARDGYEILRQQCDTVFIAGISMGGLLTLALAASADVDAAGAVVMAAPTAFQSPTVSQTPYLKYLRRTAYMPDTSDLPEIVRAEQARRGEPVVGRTYYSTWYTAAVAQMYALSQEVKRQLPNITMPLSLIYAENDDAVPLSSSDTIKQGVSSTDIEQHVLGTSRHIITQDTEREVAFGIAERFMSRILADQ